MVQNYLIFLTLGGATLPHPPRGESENQRGENAENGAGAFPSRVGGVKEEAFKRRSAQRTAAREL